MKTLAVEALALTTRLTTVSLAPKPNFQKATKITNRMVEWEKETLEYMRSIQGGELGQWNQLIGNVRKNMFLSAEALASKCRMFGSQEEKDLYLENFEELASGRIASEDFAPVASEELPPIKKENLRRFLLGVKNPDFPVERLRVSNLIQRLQNILQKEGDLPVKTYDQEEDGELTTLWAYDVEIFEGAVIIS